jgi:hypothetical protein
MLLPVDAMTCEVLGSHYAQSSPVWTGMDLARAEVRSQSTIMLALVGKEAHYDLHLDVPWCHPDDQTGSPDDFDCVYRVRPKMEPGKKWKGKMVEAVSFVRKGDAWWLDVKFTARFVS